MSTCAVKWCGKSSRTSSYKKDGITFHRFPVCPETKTKWIDATCRGDEWFPTKNSVICSRHFMDDNFHAMKNRRRLLDSALPTLNLPVLTHMPSMPSTSVIVPEANVMSISSTQATDVLSTPKTSPNRKGQLILIATHPSAYDSPVKKRLCRRIIELGNTVKFKNMQLRKLRDNNRRLKRQISSLKSIINECFI